MNEPQTPVESSDLLGRLRGLPNGSCGKPYFTPKLVRLCEAAADEIERLCRSRDFYMYRCEALQAMQDKMRDPERKAVCDILANGSTTALQPNAELSGPRPLAAEGSRSNDVLGGGERT